MADDVTLEASVLKRPIEGRSDILTLLKLAIPLYEFQTFTYKEALSASLFFESYRSQVRGVPIECMVLVHMNEQGQADSIVINHRPLEALLLFSNLMWEQVDDRFRDLYLTGPQAEALAALSEQSDIAEAGSTAGHHGQ
jgi:hypothetical protein